VDRELKTIEIKDKKNQVIIELRVILPYFGGAGGGQIIIS